MYWTIFITDYNFKSSIPLCFPVKDVFPDFEQRFPGIDSVTAEKQSAIYDLQGPVSPSSKRV